MRSWFCPILALSLLGAGCVSSGPPPRRYPVAVQDEAFRRVSESWVRIHKGEYDIAADLLMDLWLEPPPIPYFNLLEPIRVIAKRDAGARERLTEFERRLMPTRSDEPAGNWLDLNAAVGDDAALADYARIAITEPRSKKSLEYQPRLVERLIAVGEWELAGQFYENPAARYYWRKTPPVLVPFEAVARTGAAVAYAPIVYTLGPFLVSSPGSGGGGTPRPKENESQEERHLQEAGRAAAALARAGRMFEARDLYLRAAQHEGQDRARAAFETGAAQAGMRIEWDKRP